MHQLIKMVTDACESDYGPVVSVKQLNHKPGLWHPYSIGCETFDPPEWDAIAVFDVRYRATDGSGEWLAVYAVTHYSHVRCWMS